jgi:predicted esterase YcpF (UPF0227 family)
MRSLLYFHGFASSPASRKIGLLRPLLDLQGIEMNTPDLNAPSFEELDWNAIVDRAEEAARAMPPDVIAGSSMGALVALAIAQRGIVAPLVLIAPALGIADRWRSNIPEGDPIRVFNHARGEEAPIHRRFFEQMSEVRVDEAPPPSHVSIIMGVKDESVPYDSVAGTFARWMDSGNLMHRSKFIEIREGDHGLTAFAGVIAEEIQAVLPPSSRA